MQQKSVAEAISPLGWTSFFFNFASFILSVYLLLGRLKWSPSRFQADQHYRLRFILCSALTLARMAHFIKLGISFRIMVLGASEINYDTAMNSTLGTPFYDNLPSIYSHITAGFFFKWVFQSCFHTVIAFIMFITVDRYERVCLLQTTLRRDRIIQRILFYLKHLVSMCLLVVVMGYAADYTAQAITNENLKRKSALYSLLLQIRGLFELTLISVCILMDYTLTIRLIWTCIQKSRVASLQQSSLPSQHVSHSESHQDNNNEVQTHHPLETEQNPSFLQRSQFKVGQVKARLVRAQQRRERIALKMISLFLMLFFIDAVTFVFQVLFNYVSTSDTVFEQILMIVGSWLVLRVFCIFVLLDMFLRLLKQASVDTLRATTENTKTTNISSSEAEIVDLDLMSEYKTSKYEPTASGASFCKKKMAI